MKYSLTIVIWFTGLAVFAQPVFEGTIQESANVVQLETLGEVFYSMDVINKQCLIYTLDRNLLKSIPLATPEGYYLSDIQYVSESLFNSDNLIELAYIYSKYNPTDFSYYYTFETKVINENGSVLLSLPGVGFTDVVQTIDNGLKFLAYEYNYAVIPYRTKTHVYGLPDQTTQSEVHSLSSIEAGNAYPNPAGNLVTIPVSLPDGLQSGSLEVMDLNGRIIIRYPITDSDQDVVVPTSQLTPGTYIYKVCSGGTQSVGKKIVVR